MPGPLKSILACTTVLVVGGSAVFSADPPADEAFATYQNEWLGKKSGVYERNGAVFVVVRVPAEGGRARLRAKESAMRESSALLRDWAFEKADRERGAEPQRPSCIAQMVAFNDENFSGWRIPAWHIDVPGRQFPAREFDGFYHQGQVFDRETLLLAIPRSFFRHPTDEEVVAQFSEKAASVFRKNPSKVARSLGFFEYDRLGKISPDAFPPPDDVAFRSRLETFLQAARETDAGNASAEWRQVSRILAEGLARSPLCDVLSGEETALRTKGTNRAECAAPTDMIRSFLSAGLLQRQDAGSRGGNAERPPDDMPTATLFDSLCDGRDDPRIWKRLSERLKDEGRPAESHACLLNALALNPSDAEVLAEIALRYEAFGCPTLARGAALSSVAAAGKRIAGEKTARLIFESNP